MQLNTYKQFRSIVQTIAILRIILSKFLPSKNCTCLKHDMLMICNDVNDRSDVIK